MMQFQINKYIILKLENDKTNIYVNESLFQQCKFLLLEIPIDQVKYLYEVGSIDEIAEQLDNFLEDNNQTINIPLETEFWGHSSNLQVWYENGYDTRLLHSNMAFPLLKRLTEVWDPLAVKVFKEEIMKRLESGYPSVITYLLKEKYTDYISRQDLFYSLLEPKETEVILELEAFLGETTKIDDIKEYEEDERMSITIENKKIVRLQVVGCGLKYLPENLIKLTHLKHLYLNGNDFRNLPKWIGDLKALETLALRSCDLESIPESICNLKRLEKLNLVNNYLTELPISIGNLVNLKELNCGGNELEELPKSIGLLKYLEELYLNGNVIKELPDSLGNLSNLKQLVLKLNKLKFLPDTVRNLINLEKLDIDGNYFKNIPNFVLDLPKIKELKIDSNLLETVSDDMKRQLDSRHIYIGD